MRHDVFNPRWRLVIVLTAFVASLSSPVAVAEPGSHRDPDDSESTIDIRDVTWSDRLVEDGQYVEIEYTLDTYETWSEADSHYFEWYIDQDQDGSVDSTLSVQYPDKIAIVWRQSFLVAQAHLDRPDDRSFRVRFDAALIGNPASYNLFVYSADWRRNRRVIDYAGHYVDWLVHDVTTQAPPCDVEVAEPIWGDEIVCVRAPAES